MNYDTKIQDLDHAIEEKDRRIKELLHHLKLQGENTLLEPVTRPPGVARRTASIGVQTTSTELSTLDPHLYQRQQITAPKESLNDEDVVGVLKCSVTC
jgi:hypothetical protein